MNINVAGRAVVLVGLILMAGCGGKGAKNPLVPQPTPASKQLTATDGVFEANPIYSPDGTSILFESDASGNMDIWRLPAAGGVAERLTRDPGYDTAPYWMPDGRAFVFESDRGGRKAIWFQDLSAPGRDPVRITDDKGDDGSPSVSPDGHWVVYESNRGGQGIDLWVSPVVGGVPRRLTTSVDGSYDRSADWSRDGLSIVFESNRENASPALFAVPAAGGIARRLTPLSGYEGHPAWSPDGTSIAYESTRSGTMEIWRINADGSDPVQITSEGGYWPRWHPNGRSIIYGKWGLLAPNLWTIAVQ